LSSATLTIRVVLLTASTRR